MSLIICFGNPLHGDDAVGWHVYNRLSERLKAIQSTNTPEPQLRFGGSSPLDAVRYLQDQQQVVIVDACQPGEAPGRVEYARVERAEYRSDYLSVHRFSIADTLAAMQAEGLELPDIQLVSVEAKTINAFTLELSDEVAAAVEPACEIALKLAAREEVH